MELNYAKLLHSLVLLVFVLDEVRSIAPGVSLSMQLIGTVCSSFRKYRKARSLQLVSTDQSQFAAFPCAWLKSNECDSSDGKYCFYGHFNIELCTLEQAAGTSKWRPHNLWDTRPRRQFLINFKKLANNSTDPKIRHPALEFMKENPHYTSECPGVPKKYMSRQGFATPEWKWPNKLICISRHHDWYPTEEKTSYITAAAQTLNKRTSVTFKPYTQCPEDSKKLQFLGNSEGNFCKSDIDFQSRNQAINLHEPECTSLGMVFHHIIHSLGVFHTQSRYDRNDWVLINATNIKPGLEIHYKNTAKYWVDTFELDYRYESIMHSGPREHSNMTLWRVINPTKAGLKGHGLEYMGQRFFSTEDDCELITRMYNQKVTVKPKPRKVKRSFWQNIFGGG